MLFHILMILNSFSSTKAVQNGFTHILHPLISVHILTFNFSFQPYSS